MSDFLIYGPYGGSERIPCDVWDVPMDEKAVAGILATIKGVEELERVQWTDAGIPGYGPIKHMGKVAIADRQTPVSVVE